MSVEMKTVPPTRTFFISLFIIWVGLSFAINANGQRGLGNLTDVRALQEKIWTAERGTPDQAVAAMREAVEQFKTNSTAWYYYGLALSRSGDLVGARNTFKQALKFEPSFIQSRLRLAQTLLLANQFHEAETEARRALEPDAKAADAHYILGQVYLSCGDASKALAEALASIQTHSSFAPAFLLKHQATLLMLGRSKLEQQPQQLKDAIESLEKYFALAQPQANDGFLLEQLESLRFYLKAADEDAHSPNRQLFYASEVTTKAHIFTKPPPEYSETARLVHMVGAVVLAAVLSGDGNLEHILVLRSLPYGLSAKSIEAAKKVRFTPATKDGHAVSTWTQLEYNFNLY